MKDDILPNPQKRFNAITAMIRMIRDFEVRIKNLEVETEAANRLVIAADLMQPKRYKRVWKELRVWKTIRYRNSKEIK